MSVPWEFLREPMNLVSGFSMPINVLFFIVAFFLFAISFLAWRKKPSQKLLLVASAFGIFFLKSVLMVLDYFLSPGYFMNYAVQGFFDLVILGLLFIAIFRK